MRTITAQYDSVCHECKRDIEAGDESVYDDETKWIYHPDCADFTDFKNGKFSSRTDGYKKPTKGKK